jgi:hypothetical protein
MSKDKKFIGQPIFSQILKCIDFKEFDRLTNQHKSNRYYKRLPARKHLISLLYGVFTFCNGLRELTEGLLGCEGKLTHLGFDSAPARSTLSDANTKRSYLVFEALYFSLINKYLSFISDSRLRGLTIKNLKIIDSTTIRLFSDILRGVGRNPLHGARKKGGIKVHALMDAFSGVAEFLCITEAKVHDRKFLYSINLAENSFVVFDRAYVQYKQFAKWSNEKIWFVTRLKTNAKYHVKKVLTDNSKKQKRKGVIKEQLISVGYIDNGEEQRLELRRVEYLAADGRLYVFVTNNMTLKALEVANIYKYRWMIELLFKQIKQNFPLRYFWGESENAIKMQVYMVLIAQLLTVVVRKKSESKKSFANVITLIRLHLMSYVNLEEFINNAYVCWRKANAPPNLFAK